VNHDGGRRLLDGTIEWDELHPETRRLLSRRRFLTNGGKASILLLGAFSIAVTACGDDDDDDDAAGASDTTTGGTTAGPATTASLYERLGGNAAVSAVITDFVDNQVVPDTRINGFFANTDLARLKTLLTEFTANATGGPEMYTGRDMKSAHAGLGITMADFNALVEDLSKSLDVFMVPAQEQGELLAALAPLSADIVEAG
jgi:hemoglobin